MHGTILVFSIHPSPTTTNTTKISTTTTKTKPISRTCFGRFWCWRSKLPPRRHRPNYTGAARTMKVTTLAVPVAAARSSSCPLPKPTCRPCLGTAPTWAVCTVTHAASHRWVRSARAGRTSGGVSPGPLRTYGSRMRPACGSGTGRVWCSKVRNCLSMVAELYYRKKIIKYC